MVANPLHACGHVEPPPGYSDDDDSYRNLKPGTNQTVSPARLSMSISNKLQKLRTITINKNSSSRSEPITPMVGQLQWILIASKSSCSYSNKIQYAHRAGYTAIIIFNEGSNETEVIGLNENQFDLLIPAYFVGAYHGRLLRNKFSYHRDERVK